ncbi:hypothetical protein ON010_g18769 [Phytophthora cinnamomi]|nr:hypothetical protein ON010_g18769 [Phytophthora cinnamomi]
MTGITAGTATPGAALVVAPDGSLSGLGALSCSSLTANGAAVPSAPSYVIGITPGTAAFVEDCLWRYWNCFAQPTIAGTSSTTITTAATLYIDSNDDEGGAKVVIGRRGLGSNGVDWGWRKPAGG